MAFRSANVRPYALSALLGVLVLTFPWGVAPGCYISRLQRSNNSLVNQIVTVETVKDPEAIVYHLTEVRSNEILTSLIASTDPPRRVVVR